MQAKNYENYSWTFGGTEESFHGNGNSHSRGHREREREKAFAVFRHRDDVNCSPRADRNDLYTGFHVQRRYTSMPAPTRDACANENKSAPMRVN